jgi:5-hydroxyisourate hydrolase
MDVAVLTTVSVSTHVLDLTLGRPAAGLMTRFERRLNAGWKWVASNQTDADGNIAGWRAPVVPGAYRIIFDTEGYFHATGRECLYPEVVVHLRFNGERSYHVPLLLGPFAYSTYLGS